MVVAGGAGGAVVVARIVLGTSSTQVEPGSSGMTCPAELTNCVGEPRVERCQLPWILLAVAEDDGRAAGVGIQVRLHLEAAL